MRRIAMVWKWVVVCSLLWTLPSQAAVLDPLAFTSLGMLNATDSISINTDRLQLTGGASYTGVLDPVSGAGIFTFDGISGTNLSIFGTRTLGLLSKGNLSFTGTIDLLGSGGLEMVAVGAMTLANLQTAGSGGTVSLTAGQLNVGGAVDAGSRPLDISVIEPIRLTAPIPIQPDQIILRDIGLSARNSLNITTGAGSSRGTVNLGSGVITLTSGTNSGSTQSGVVTVSAAGEIVGSPNVGVVAPVPLPASLLLFATGLTAFGLLKRRTK
jgi:hypothetical protein